MGGSHSIKGGIEKPPWHTQSEGSREGDLERAWIFQCYCGSLANSCLIFLFKEVIKY